MVEDITDPQEELEIADKVILHICKIHNITYIFYHTMLSICYLVLFLFQRDTKFKTTVVMEDCRGSEVFFNISTDIGRFNPFLFLYIDNVSTIDISGCRDICATDFVECVIGCRNLSRLIMQSCTQFSQYQMCKIVSRLLDLKYVDLEKCQELSYPTAYWMISCLKKLERINFEPLNASMEIEEWKKLYNTFFRVSFGHNFKRIFPFYGNYVRLPEDYDEE